jgi:hypothetical protein
MLLKQEKPKIIYFRFPQLARNPQEKLVRDPHLLMAAPVDLPSAAGGPAPAERELVLAIAPA